MSEKATFSFYYYLLDLCVKEFFGTIVMLRDVIMQLHKMDINIFEFNVFGPDDWGRVQKKTVNILPLFFFFLKDYENLLVDRKQ